MTMNINPLTYNSDQIVSLVTKAIVAASTGWATAHGFSASDWTNVVAYIVGAAAIVFAHYWRAPDSTPPSSKPAIKLMLFLMAAIPVITGCAYMKSNTHSLTSYTTNGVQMVEQDTRSRAWTFFDANSSLSKFRNGSSNSTIGTNTIAPGTYASGINESSSSSNLLNGVSQITAAAVSAFVQSAK
jgi:hypothetical protein